MGQCLDADLPLANFCSSRGKNVFILHNRFFKGSLHSFDQEFRPVPAGSFSGSRDGDLLPAGNCDSSEQLLGDDLVGSHDEMRGRALVRKV